MIVLNGSLAGQAAVEKCNNLMHTGIITAIKALKDFEKNPRSDYLWQASNNLYNASMNALVCFQGRAFYAVNETEDCIRANKLREAYETIHILARKKMQQEYMREPAIASLVVEIIHMLSTNF